MVLKGYENLMYFNIAVLSLLFVISGFVEFSVFNEEFLLLLCFWSGNYCYRVNYRRYLHMLPWRAPPRLRWRFLFLFRAPQVSVDRL